MFDERLVATRLFEMALVRYGFRLDTGESQC